MTVVEVNFDGLVGPTHHHGGLGVGNVASHAHEGQTSSPRAAALQGLDKMARIAALGVPQAILPPAPRPALQLLRSAGFSGTTGDVLRAAAKHAPRVLSAAYSASSMWAANAATVSPAADCGDGRTHLSVANLISSLHRSTEPAWTTDLLRRVLGDPDRFVVHDPLAGGLAMRDEGAANHMRLFSAAHDRGVEVFVYGAGGAEPSTADGRWFPRQTRLASEAVARRHRLAPDRAFFLAQHPRAIAAGAFHNDVVATSCRGLLLFHQQAFTGQSRQQLPEIVAAVRRHAEEALQLVEVSEKELPLDDAVASYLFNSQIVIEGGGPDGPLVIVCPAQCGELPASRAVLQRLVEAGIVARAEFVELRESMHNGGGPACLRLRIPLDERDRAAVHPGVWWTEETDRTLRQAINRHYRDSLSLPELADPSFATEAGAAQDAVLRVLDLDRLTSPSA